MCIRDSPNSLVVRSATATAGIGEFTIYSTSGASGQTITLPASPQNGAIYQIKNLSAYTVSIKGGTNSVSVSGTVYGAAATYTIPLNAAYSFVFTGGIWYCFLTTDLAQMANVLPVASGGTGSSVSLGLTSSQTASLNGFIAQSFDVASGPAPTSKALTAGTCYFTAVYLIAGQVLNKYNFYCQAASAGQTYVGLYTSSGLISGTSVSNSSGFGSTGLNSFSLASPYTVPTTGVYWVGLIVGGACSVSANAYNTAAGVNWPTSTNPSGTLTGVRFGTQSQSTLPATISGTVTLAAQIIAAGLN